MINISIRDRSYRTIYQKHYGNIPVDADGRFYEIHQIDGDHTNNDPSNLKAVTIQEHYNIHYRQGDWYVCLLIFEALNITPEEKSNLSRLAKTTVESGIEHHYFLRKIASINNNNLFAFYHQS